MYNKDNKIIIISGPTAVGKSRIGIELAKKIDGEIISIDSMQIYKGMDIGTAKITKDEMQGIKHYMIDEISINDNYNVKEFKSRTYECIKEIQNKHKIPILIGGTGFYINAILYDTDFLYEDEGKKELILNELNNELKLHDNDYMYEKLKEIDQESAEIIDKNNTKRLLRAILYYKMHNEKISTHNKREQQKAPKYNALCIFLNDNRQKLYKNIDKRVDLMVNQGLIKEICDLIVNNDAKKESNAMQAIGYKELYSYCEKLISKNEKDLSYESLKTDNQLIEIIDKIKQHSRNYAKRQITWFKNKTNAKEIRIDDYSYDDEKILEKIIFELKKM